MDIFMARQAIYNIDYEPVAYELLYRSTNENRFDSSIDGDTATMKLISNCVSIGFKELIREKKAFINFTENLIINEYPTILPSEKIVIEVLEDVNASIKTINCLRNLKKKGYILALDDVTYKTEYWTFGPLFDIYKIDFRSTTYKERKDIILGIKVFNPNAKFLAEKIETEEEYEEAKGNNYSYFQGYFFSKPIVLSGQDMPIRNFTCFKIMTELVNDNYNIDRVEELIKTDVTISYKIIKMLNSAAFSFVQNVSSIKQAIMLIGKEELSKLLTVITISEMESNNEKEITRTTVVRARFCEKIAEHINSKWQSQSFMAGLFSNIDLYIQKDMVTIIDELPIDEELKDALEGKDNEINRILRLVEAYERVDNNEILELCKKLRINEEILVNLYVEAINWENTINSNLW
ncbi:MAG: HDOD domain-containing protein [Clostridiales bacterium]|nr:HDOD domain-containing protein [Clostridiales bacterium]